MTATASVDQAKAEAFVGKALGDMASTMTVLMATLGDGAGLFAALRDAGGLRADEIAERAGTDRRYTREWLAGMTAAGYIEYDAATECFVLPDEHAPVLADEGGPVFFAGAWQEIAGALPHLDRIRTSLRTGGGVPPAEYGATFWDGLERFTAGWFGNLLLPVWIPAMPAVRSLLERGSRVADVGCGAGRALVALATAYPESRFVGYDAVPRNVERARRHAAEAGVDDRVSFEVRDATMGIPERFDVVFTFDVVHDAADPAGLLTAIRTSLEPGGRYVCLDINASHRLEENVGPLGTVFYGFSLLFCMTSSLGMGGKGLGTCGFTEPVVRVMCADAGFSELRRVPLDNPFNVLYEAVP